MINRDNCSKIEQVQKPQVNKVEAMRKVVIDTLRQVKGVETKLKEILDTIKQ